MFSSEFLSLSELIICHHVIQCNNFVRPIVRPPGILFQKIDFSISHYAKFLFKVQFLVYFPFNLILRNFGCAYCMCVWTEPYSYQQRTLKYKF